VYVLDTDVISKLRLNADPPVAVWMQEHADVLFITSTTIAEIEAGVVKLRREGATKKAGDVSDWLDALVHLYGERVLPFDLSAARIAGAMTDRARAAGHTAGFADTTIAAIAASRGFTVLTCNLEHFAHLGAAAVDPFDTLPRQE
jgi:predicted nucleic acid-binding protein